MDNFGGGSGSVLPTIRRPIRTGCRRFFSCVFHVKHRARAAPHSARAAASSPKWGRGPDRGSGYIMAIRTTPLPRSDGTSGSLTAGRVGSAMSRARRCRSASCRASERHRLHSAQSYPGGGGSLRDPFHVKRVAVQPGLACAMRLRGEALSPRGVEPLVGVESSGLPCAAARRMGLIVARNLCGSGLSCAARWRGIVVRPDAGGSPAGARSSGSPRPGRRTRTAMWAE